MASILIFHYHLENWCKLQSHAAGEPSDFVRVYVWAMKQEKFYTQGELKLNHKNFTILNSHVTVIYLRFIKNTYFYVVKQKNRKYPYWLLSSNKTVTMKLHLSENLTFQNLLKIRKPLAAEKFGNILAFHKESKRKLLSHISRQFY